MPHSNSTLFEFGSFQLNAAQRVLTRAGESISLTPKAMDILLVLVARAGELVGKEELLAAVWPDSFVEEGNLSQAIFMLRRVLGDNRSEAQFIETVPRHGYRFVAQVRQPPNGTPTTKDSPVTLAVLPFVNDTGDAELEYLADGVGENIIKSLSQISKLRVMSRSSTGRFKGREVDLKSLRSELRVDSILIGRVAKRNAELLVSVELVDAANGWLLWGEGYECSSKDILEIQDEIVRCVSRTLRLELSGDEEKQITARYTNSSHAYQAYLQGRFYWSRFTRSGIESAIQHFRTAIDLDPGYALAYAGIIDCYLRLVTNYLPPEVLTRKREDLSETETSSTTEAHSKLKLRHEWDWKGAERELRRAKELKVGYPAAHQWHAAYVFARNLYLQKGASKVTDNSSHAFSRLPPQIGSATLTPSEEVQVFCLIAREQIVVGNYEGARLMVERWLPSSGWPKLDHLDAHMAADLLFTLGNVVCALVGTGRISKRHKRAESYLSGSIGMFAHLGSRNCALEARAELARCYFREGLFAEARDALSLALAELSSDETELKGLCLSLYGCIEREAGRLHESLEKFTEAGTLETGHLVAGHRQLQIATTLKELAILEKQPRRLDQASFHFERAIFEFEAIGNHRNIAAANNNYGYFLLCSGRYSESEHYLRLALQLFESFFDEIRAAQVNETLTHLYVALSNFSAAREAIDRAVTVFEKSDSSAVLAEALITKATVAANQQQYVEARADFERAHSVAERAGDFHGASRALLCMLEQLALDLDDMERRQLGDRITRFTTRTK